MKRSIIGSIVIFFFTLSFFSEAGADECDRDCTKKCDKNCSSKCDYNCSSKRCKGKWPVIKQACIAECVGEEKACMGVCKAKELSCMNNCTADEDRCRKKREKEKNLKTVRPVFTVESGSFFVNIHDAIELLSIEVIIANWKEPAHSYIDITQPSRKAVRIKRKDYANEPHDNISSKYTFIVNKNSMLSRKHINGDWKISVPGSYESMVVTLVVNKRG